MNYRQAATKDETYFQLTKWLPDLDFELVTTALAEGGIRWETRTLDEEGRKRFSIWREKRGYVARTI